MSILNVRRHIIMNQPEMIRVTWNQLAPPVEATYWMDYDSTCSSTTYADGIASMQWLVNKRGYYTTNVIRAAYKPSYQAGDVIYFSYQIMPDPIRESQTYNIELCGALLTI